MWLSLYNVHSYLPQFCMYLVQFDIMDIMCPIPVEIISPVFLPLFLISRVFLHYFCFAIWGKTLSSNCTACLHVSLQPLTVCLSFFSFCGSPHIKCFDTYFFLFVWARCFQCSLCYFIGAGTLLYPFVSVIAMCRSGAIQFSLSLTALAC